MTRLQKLVVLVLMLPPWAALVVVSYWLLIDNRNPVQVVYQHPKFTDRDVANRQEAARHEVDAAASGDFVWIYRELCVHSSLYGTARGSWISGAFLWQTPERTVVPLPLGCYSRSFNIRVPTTSPTRDFTYRVTWVYDLNPLASAEIEMPSIELRVFAPGDVGGLRR